MRSIRGTLIRWVGGRVAQRIRRCSRPWQASGRALPWGARDLSWRGGHCRFRAILLAWHRQAGQFNVGGRLRVDVSGDASTRLANRWLIRGKISKRAWDLQEVRGPLAQRENERVLEAGLWRGVVGRRESSVDSSTAVGGREEEGGSGDGLSQNLHECKRVGVPKSGAVNTGRQKEVLS